MEVVSEHREETKPLAKILFIGVDAGDKDLILRWARAGVLPTFRSLLERGAWGETNNPIGFFVGAIWPSFFTGNSPARHGRYCYSQLRPGTYDHHRFQPSDVRSEPFWNTLSRAGRRVAIIDVPKTSLAADLNGIQLVDWGTHDRDLSFRTWPAPLAAEVKSLFGHHPLHKCDGQRSSPAEFKVLRDALVSGVKKKGELASYFLDRGAWDLFITVFAESHCVGHQCWHVHDETHPKHDPEVARGVGDPIRDVYIAIDAEIGRLLERVGSEATVFILASHGMGPHYDGTFLLDKILSRLDSAQLSAPRRRLLKVFNWGRHKILKPLPRRVRRKLRKAADRLEKSRRQCFQVLNNDVYGAIRINLVGREPHGRVRPGPECDAFGAELSRDLLTVVNLDTGEPAVARVLRTTDLYLENDGGLPDLLVEWNRKHPISTVHSPKTGTIHRTFRGNRTGDHKPDGLFFALGPAVKRGYLEKPVSIMDFAPTFGSLLGAPIPEVEGNSMANLIGQPP